MDKKSVAIAKYMMNDDFQNGQGKPCPYESDICR
jgi:hypothetical protein